MAAYLIIDIRAVHDPAKLNQYQEQFEPFLERYGGRRLAASDRAQVLEGDWQPGYLVLYEFESLEQLRVGYESEEYQPLKRLRQEAVTNNIVVVEGL